MIGQLAQMVGVLEEEAGDEFIDGVGGVVEELFRLHHGGVCGGRASDS